MFTGLGKTTADVKKTSILLYFTFIPSQLLAVLKSKTLQTDINLRIQPIKQDEDIEANG